MLPTILEGRNDQNLVTVPEETTSDVSSDADDNYAPQPIYRDSKEKEILSDGEPALNSGVKDGDEIEGAGLPIPILTARQELHSQSSTVTKLPFESDFHSALKVEEMDSKSSGLTSVEPKVSSHRSRSPSPAATDPHHGDGFKSATSKEVAKPRAPITVITHANQSQSPNLIGINLQNGNEYHASPLQEPVGVDESIVTSTHVTSKYHDGEESPRSSSLAEFNTKERPDPIGGVATVPSQRYDEERAKTGIREAEKVASEGGDSTDYSLDSARGDSLLRAVDENSHSGSGAHPRFVLMNPSEGSTAGNYEVCLYGTHLDEAVMLHAQVFIDIYNVSKENWRVVTGRWPSLAPEATHCLQIRVPPMPSGEAWIEVETLNDGRLQSPRPFVFTDNFSLKHSMRGMGGQVSGTSLPTIDQPAPSSADFEFSLKAVEEEERRKVAKMNAKNFDSIESAKMEISKLYSEITRLKVELQAKSADEVRVARELCILRTRLLEDGQLKYLERN